MSNCNKMKNIVIYGAGKFGGVYLNILRELNLDKTFVCYCDRKFDQLKKVDNYDVVPVSKIINLDAWVLISIQNVKIRNDVCHELTRQGLVVFCSFYEFMEKAHLPEKYFKKYMAIINKNNMWSLYLPNYGRIQKKADTVHLGTEYGGYVIDRSVLPKHPIVYSIGIGEDDSFDKELIKKFDAEVYAFDPTPKAVNYVAKGDKNDKFHFYPYGLSDYDGQEKFHLPVNKEYVSGSVISWDGVQEDYIAVEMCRLSTMMNRLGHDHIDVLKIDIEGSEFKVIPDIIQSGVIVHQLCLEVHGRFFENDGMIMTEKLVHDLNRVGMYIIDVEPYGEVISLIKVEN